MEELSSVDKGDASEASVIAELKRRGYTVLTPFGDNERYDLVFEEDDNFIRAQVKTGRLVDDSSVVFDCCGNHTNTKGTTVKKYDASEIDCFLVYVPKVNDFLRVSINEAPETTMTLRYDSKQNQSSINWVEEYKL